MIDQPGPLSVGDAPIPNASVRCQTTHGNSSPPHRPERPGTSLPELFDKDPPSLTHECVVRPLIGLFIAAPPVLNAGRKGMR